MISNIPAARDPASGPSCLPCYRKSANTMHIPDGFLTVPVWASLDAVAIPAVAAISWRAQRQMVIHFLSVHPDQ